MTVAYNKPAVLPYGGNDLVKVFPITFPTFENQNIIAVVSDLDGEETTLVEGADYTLSGIAGVTPKLTLVNAADVPPGWVLPIPPSQAWLTGGNLSNGFTLFIKFDPAAYQPVVLRTTGRLSPESIEKQFDRVNMLIQALKSVSDRTIKFSDTTFEVDGSVITGEELLARLEDLEGTFSDGNEFDYLEANDQGKGRWEDGVFSGFSGRFNENFSAMGIREAILKILDMVYAAPLISVSTSPAASIFEKGAVMGPVTINANTTKRTNPITIVDYYLNGALLGVEAAPIATGGAESFVGSGTFTGTTTFMARAGDGTAFGSGSVTFTGVYPYFAGTNVPDILSFQVALLTKIIVGSTASMTRTFTPADGDVYYFAYPAAYGVLTKVLDSMGFDNIGDWTRRTENITMLDSSAQSYYIYEFNNIVAATTQIYTFVR